VWSFFIFQPSKIRVSPTGVISSLPLPGATSPLADVATPCHGPYPWSHDKLATFTSSSSNASYHCLPSRAEIEALNPHHRRLPPSPDSLTPTLHCCKKVISILITLPTIQPYLYFASSSQSTTLSEHHPPPSFPFTTVPCPSSLRTTTLIVMN
jgi:hypothetical protein